jgi:amidase
MSKVILMRKMSVGGSIRKPSAFCGLYSIRPTTHRLPYYGASNIFEGSIALESTLGPMARSFNSVEYFMRVLVDAKPWQFDAGVVKKLWESQKGKVKEKKCFGVMWHDGEVRCHPPLERALRDSVRALKEAGHDGAYLLLLWAEISD